MGLGDRLRDIRVGKGVTVNEVARLVRSTKASWEQVESGEILPNLRTLERFSSMMQLSLV